MSDNTKEEATDAMKRLARMKVSDALCYLLGGNRFYYYIISNIQIKSSKDVQNIEVGFADKKSKKICIRYNPDFIANFHYEHPTTGQKIKYEFSEQELSDILVHELLHICLRHLFNVEQYTDKDVLNIAQDIIVNDMIFRNRYEYTRMGNPMDALANDKRPSLVNFLVSKHLFESTKDLNISEHTFGDIYGMLEKEFQQNPQLKQEMGNRGQKGQLIKDGHAEFKGDDEGEAEGDSARGGEIEAMVKNLLNKAMKEDFDRGRLPAELLKELNALEPKVDYKDTLNHFVKNCKVDVLQNTWKKPSKRYGFIARGKTADFKPKILLGVDSSGSVFCHPKALEKIGEYFNFAVNFCEKIRLIYCDTNVRLDKDFVQGDTIPPIEGGGGTVMQPIFDKGLEDEYDAVILITDGYTDVINTHGLPHLALIVPGGTTPPGIEKNNTVFFNDNDA